jgi:hypothetical protein
VWIQGTVWTTWRREYFLSYRDMNSEPSGLNRIFSEYAYVVLFVPITICSYVKNRSIAKWIFIKLNIEGSVPAIFLRVPISSSWYRIILSAILCEGVHLCPYLELKSPYIYRKQNIFE